MKKNNTRKLALAAVFTAVAVVGSLFSFPVFGSKCAPVQHIVNILCAVFLGPVWGVCVAFAASLLRNLLGLGSLMAFPGSMIGALLCGLAYMAMKGKTAALPVTLLAEIFKGGNFGQFSGLSQHGTGSKYLIKNWRSLQLVREYPAEALSEPLFRTYHFFWRKKNV